ncbi:MAG TPA: family 16 glycosylhydrolase [Rhizomicrobium sp.]|nr:family 16 glycosylhydrolase [Rhizomicrobium sp.]
MGLPKWVIQGFLFSWIVGCLPAGASPPSAPEGLRWQITEPLSDGFSGPNLDRSKWLDTNPKWPGRLPSLFTAGNVSVRGGFLHLTTTTFQQDSRGSQPAFWIAAATIRSRDQSAFYGYYEARLRASDLATTSSFWLKGTFSEIDITEAVGASNKRHEMANRMHASSHYLSNGGKIDQVTTAMIPTLSSVTDWHTYGVWWKDARTLWFYLDNKIVSEQTTKGDFTEPMFLYFDTEAVEDTDGLPDEQALRDPHRNAMLVDWVRSYKLVPAH